MKTGTTRTTGRWLSMAAALLASGCLLPSGDHGAVGGLDAAAAFARMKTLVGSYDPPAPEPDGSGKVSYEVTSGGHSLMEKLNVGSEHEMVSVYYLEGRDLALVHYCAIGNRPHMRLDRVNSTLDDLRFEWDGTATDIDPAKDPHIHSARFHFLDAGHAQSEWTFWTDGKEAHKKTFALDLAAAKVTMPAASAPAGAAPEKTPPPAPPAK